MDRSSTVSILKYLCKEWRIVLYTLPVSSGLLVLIPSCYSIFDPACTEHLLGGWHCDGLKNECNVVPPLKCFSLWEEAEMSSMSLLICPNVLVYGQGVQIEENWLYLPRGSRV